MIDNSVLLHLIIILQESGIRKDHKIIVPHDNYNVNCVTLPLSMKKKSSLGRGIAQLQVKNVKAT